MRSRPDAVKAVASAEGLVLLDIPKGIFFRSNHVGARIWSRLLEGVTIDQVVEEIAEEFGIPREIVSRDVHEFLQSLAERNYLQAVEPK